MANRNIPDLHVFQKFCGGHLAFFPIKLRGGRYIIVVYSVYEESDFANRLVRVYLQARVEFYYLWKKISF